MKKRQLIIEEPLASYNHSSELNADAIWQLFKVTDLRFKETDAKFQETDKQLSELIQLSKQRDKEWEEIKKELRGIGKSNGEIAEDYFASALGSSLKIAGMQFDMLDSNLSRKSRNTEAEFDIILFNENKVVVVEVKYNYRLPSLRQFHQQKLKKFRTLFPEHRDKKLYGAIAAMTFGRDVMDAACKYGFYILTQYNDKLKVLNPEDFKPTEIKNN